MKKIDDSYLVKPLLPGQNARTVQLLDALLLTDEELYPASPETAMLTLVPKTAKK